MSSSDESQFHEHERHAAADAAGQDWHDRLPSWSELAAVLGVAALVAPLAGAAVRIVWFLADGVPDPLFLASAAPFTELVATGLRALPSTALGLLFTILIVAYANYSRNYGRSEDSPAEEMDWRFRARVIAAWILLFVGIPVIFVTFPDPLIVLVAGAIAAVVYGFWPEARTPFVRVLLPVVLVYTGATVSAGLGQDRVAHKYRFTEGSGLESGLAVPLGAADGLVYLRFCAGRSIVGVAGGVITSVTLNQAEFAPRRGILDEELGVFTGTADSDLLGPRDSCSGESHIQGG
jgi:hypothetical protein